jgi:Sigma-70 region 2
MDAERKEPVTNLQECDVAERFLDRADEDSFTDLFRIFSPLLASFFRRGGHETGFAEDLAQEAMLTVYRKAGQVRDHKLFRSWLFQGGATRPAATMPIALSRFQRST